MVKKAKMIFRINIQGISKDTRYSTYPSYYIDILEENPSSGNYEYKGSWYITEDNFLDMLLSVLQHEKDVDNIRQRNDSYPNLIEKIRQRKIHEFLGL